MDLRWLTNIAPHTNRAAMQVTIANRSSHDRPVMIGRATPRRAIPPVRSVLSKHMVVAGLPRPGR